MYSRILRFSSAQSLARNCAKQLMKNLIQLQKEQETVHLCLTGGRIAKELYTEFAELVPESKLELGRLQLWWGDDRFVPLADAERNSQQALSILARTMQISSANTHLMPAVDGKSDPTQGAFTYAQELGDIDFDICLLSVGAEGHVASIFPNHPSFEATGNVIGVTDAPKPPSERISLTLTKLDNSKSIWVLASGASKAEAVCRGIAADPELPIGHIHGTDSTWWWLDEAAASKLPPYPNPL